MSQNCNITNLSSGISLIETYISNTRIIQVKNNNNTIINPRTTNTENYICYYLSDFSYTYTIDIIQDALLNYVLFGDGAPGDEQKINATLVSGVSNATSTGIINWPGDTRKYKYSVNYGFGGSSGGLANGSLPCKENTTITITNDINAKGLSLSYNGQTVIAGNATKTVSNNIIKGTGGLVTYSSNWSYSKNSKNGDNKIDSYSGAEVTDYPNSKSYTNTVFFTPRPNDTQNITKTFYGPNSITPFITNNAGKTNTFQTPFKIDNNDIFSTYGGNTTSPTLDRLSNTVIASTVSDPKPQNTMYVYYNSPSFFEPSINMPGTNGSSKFALIYINKNVVDSKYTLTSNDTKLYINTSTRPIYIVLTSNNFSNCYECEITNIGKPINNIIINSNTTNIQYNYNTSLINNQSISLRNIKLIFNNSTWFCIAS